MSGGFVLIQFFSAHLAASSSRIRCISPSSQSQLFFAQLCIVNPMHLSNRYPYAYRTNSKPSGTHDFNLLKAKADSLIVASLSSKTYQLPSPESTSVVNKHNQYNHWEIQMVHVRTSSSIHRKLPLILLQRWDLNCKAASNSELQLLLQGSASRCLNSRARKLPEVFFYRCEFNCRNDLKKMIGLLTFSLSRASIIKGSDLNQQLVLII